MSKAGFVTEFHASRYGRVAVEVPISNLRRGATRNPRPGDIKECPPMYQPVSEVSKTTTAAAILTFNINRGAGVAIAKILKEQSRVKDGVRCVQPVLSFSSGKDALRDLILCELAYGGQVTEVDRALGFVQVETQVMGDTDTSIYRGFPKDLEPISEFLLYYLESTETLRDHIVQRAAKITEGWSALLINMGAGIILGSIKVKAALLLMRGIQDKRDIKYGMLFHPKDLMDAFDMMDSADPEIGGKSLPEYLSGNCISCLNCMKKSGDHFFGPSHICVRNNTDIRNAFTHGFGEHCWVERTDLLPEATFNNKLMGVVQESERDF